MAQATIQQLQQLLAVAVRDGRISQTIADTHLRQYQANPEGYDLGGAAYVFDPGNSLGFQYATGAGAGGTTKVPPVDIENIWGYEAPYRAAYGLTGDTLGPWGRYMQQFQPASAQMFRLQQRLGNVPELGYTPVTEYGKYLPPTAGGGPPVYGQAKDILGRMMGMTPEQRRQAALYVGGGAGMAGGDVGEGLSEEQLQSLMSYGLRSGLGKYGAQSLAARLPDIRQAYLARTLAGGGEPQSAEDSFLEYLKQQYGLQRWA